MFDKNFYPTPTKVIRQMLAPYLKEVGEIRKDQRDGSSGFSLYGKYILEPSAGKGDILDYISNQFSRGYDAPKLYAIESNTELQEIIKGKKYNLLHQDFLTYNGDTLFNLIVMNPPFDKGDQHLLKAWEIMYEGNIVCLLNSETLENPYTETRQHINKIISEHGGTVEKLGPCFDTAQRKTNVNVSLVRLTKKAKNNKFKFQFDTKGKEKSPEDLNEETIKKNEIAVRDVIGNTVIQYEQLKTAYVSFIKGCEALSYYSEDLNEGFNILDVAKDSLSLDDKTGSFNKFAGAVKMNAWRRVLNKAGIEKYMTHNVRQNFQQFAQEQGGMDFTQDNIYAVIKMIVGNFDTILEKAIEEVFDIFTRHHQENRYLVEGWKTNDAWKVNRKVILPYAVQLGSAYDTIEDRKQYGHTWSIMSRRYSEYSDIDKALCYLTGKKYEDITTIEKGLKTRFTQLGKIYTGPHPPFEAQSTFFDMKFYIKGTLHLTFRSKEVWEKFNMEACRLKKWLPKHEADAWKRRKAGMDPQKPKAKTNGTKQPKAEDLCPVVTEGQGMLF